MSQQRNGTALEVLLEKEYQLTNQLTDILKSEQQCLAENNIEALPNITAQKPPLLNELEGYAQQRKALLPESERSQSINSLINRNNDALKAARDLNEVNGTVIAVSLHNTKKIVDILHGTKATTNTYDNKGKATSSRGTNGHIEI